MASRHQIVTICLTYLATNFLSVTYADNWSGYSDIKAAMISYQGDTTRKSLTDYGINLQSKYLDKLDLLIGYSQLKLNAGQGNNVRQNQFFAGANWFQYADLINGRVGWHLKGYSLTSPSSTIVNVYTGGLSYLNYGKTFYLDTLFTQSLYKNTQGNDNVVNQSNLAIEFSPGLKSSWLSLQLFMLDNEDDVLFDNTLYSANIEWTQFFGRSGLPIPMKLIVGAQLGDQHYLVLHRLDSINNSPDVQQTSYWANATWQINDHSELGLSIVTSEYQTEQQENYSSIYSSILLKIKW